jgi:hypothetical protein
MSVPCGDICHRDCWPFAGFPGATTASQRRRSPSSGAPTSLSGRGYPVPLVDQTPSALEASRQVRQRSPSSGKQRRLGVEAPREYDLSPATLRAVRSRLSETPAPSTVGSTGALVSDG